MRDFSILLVSPRLMSFQLNTPPPFAVEDLQSNLTDGEGFLEAWLRLFRDTLRYYHGEDLSSSRYFGDVLRQLCKVHHQLARPKDTKR